MRPTAARGVWMAEAPGAEPAQSPTDMPHPGLCSEGDRKPLKDLMLGSGMSSFEFRKFTIGKS